MKMQLRFSLILLSVFLFTPVFAEYNRLGIPDSSEIRQSIAETWFHAPVEYVRTYSPKIVKNNIGQLFQVSTEEKDNYFFTIIAPQVMMSVDVYTEEGITQDIISTYPEDEAGSWILVRNKATGKGLEIRLFFSKNRDVYIRLSPDKNKTSADFIIGDCYAARAVPIGIPFENFYKLSFEELISVTEKSLPWNYVEIYPAQYNDTVFMINTIKKNLKRISVAPDACYDENGRPVYISTGLERTVSDEELSKGNISLSSEGFIKWIIDGLVEPLSGSGIFVDAMLRSTVSYNPLGYAGIRDGKDDISFTLDWTRNLAAARFSIQTRKNYLYEQTGVDVTIEPFSSEVTDEGILLTAGYLKNTGYNIDKLQSLLYVLGVSNPTYCYLAAIREKINGVEGKSPELYVFDKSAAIFPYFDKEGRFMCTVFENGTEMSLETFVKSHPGCYVHLTRVLTSSKFNPL